MSQHWTCAKCARNGVAFELNPDGWVLRIAPETLREALLPATFVTEDAVLNSLLETARAEYLDPDPKVRQESLENYRVYTGQA